VASDAVATKAAAVRQRPGTQAEVAWHYLQAGLEPRRHRQYAAQRGGASAHAHAAHTSRTVLKTGSPRCLPPPLPGDTPPRIFVPYSIACSEWKVPCSGNKARCNRSSSRSSSRSRRGGIHRATARTRLHRLAADAAAARESSAPAFQ